MYSWFRLARIGVSSLFRSRLEFLGESSVGFVVSPMDLDAYVHMNNGRYLTIMDFGRLDLMLRNGFFRACLKHRWQPVVAGVNVRFNKPLGLLNRVFLKTRFLCWVGKDLYVREDFERDSRTTARAVVKMAILGRGGGKVSIQEVAEAAGYVGNSPGLPPEIDVWERGEQPDASKASC